jgi:hypothetical protein
MKFTIVIKTSRGLTDIIGPPYFCSYKAAEKQILNSKFYKTKSLEKYNNALKEHGYPYQYAIEVCK